MIGKQKNWSHSVTDKSDSLDLEHGVFTWSDPHEIAMSLKKSAETSTRGKGTPYQSAMSMLSFYINRAGKRLPAEQKRILEDTKEQLRELFGKHR